MAELTGRDAQSGKVVWIGLRPGRRQPMLVPDHARIGASGLEGDHAPPGKRALTLFQAEHLPAISGYLGGAAVQAERLRRNIHIAGLNLSALRHARLRLGSAQIEITGPCAPCSRMWDAFGPGGYNAVRGHGGWYATVIEPGSVAIGDMVQRAPV